MKLFSILTIICTCLCFNFSYAQQEPDVIVKPIEEPDVIVKPIEEIEVAEMDFDKLPEESQVGDLVPVVKDEEPAYNEFVQQISSRSRYKLYPYAETLAYVNGTLCHVGNYPQSVIYTVLEGPYYGTQTTMTYDGIVLYINYDYDIDYVPGGAILYHYYSDSKVCTGSTQVVKMY